MPATPPPNVTLMQPTDPPYYCCCCEQEWGETVQAPLLVGNSQDPSTVEDAPTRHDKLLNPATKLPDPAPNLADIASLVSVHGESFKTPWPKQEYFEVPPPEPNIHVKTCKEQFLYLLYGNTNTSITGIVLLGIYMLHICILWKLLKHHGKLGSDRILYRKSYGNNRILYRKSYSMTLPDPGWHESHTVQSSTPRPLDLTGFCTKNLVTKAETSVLKIGQYEGYHGPVGPCRHIVQYSTYQGPIF
jgi:hypothetical protein